MAPTAAFKTILRSNCGSCDPAGQESVHFTGLDLLTEEFKSQVELSNQISGLQFGFKRMRLIGFPGWTLVITSTMSKSLNMPMLQLGPQYLRNASPWESNHCLFIIIILFWERLDSARQLLCGILSRVPFCWGMNCLFLQNNSLHFWSLYILECICILDLYVH